MNSKDLMIKKIDSLSTAQLLEMARALNLKTDSAEMMVSTLVERELEKRLSETDFLALMAEFEAELMAA